MSMGGGKKPVSQQPKKALGIDFQGAQYGPPIPVVYGQNKVAGNCIWYGDFQAIAQQQKQSGGKGGGGSSSTTSYTYKASYQLALCEGPISSVPTIYNGTSTTSLSALGAVLSTGTTGQAAWSHLSGSAALGYSNTAVVSFANRDLGSQASLPNDNFEVAGLKQYGGGIVDAEFSQIFTDICNDTQHGLSGVVPLGDLTQWHNYCVAASLFVSPVYDQQDTAQSALEHLLKYGNAAAWFSEGKLKVGCYGDQTITGNGVTYTPNLTSVASLGPDDFITNGSSPPVTISRTSPADALNLMRVEFKDRTNTYHDSAVVASMDQDIITNGGRSEDSESVDMATTSAVASQIAWNMLLRKFYVRNQYEFKLSWRYCYLEPFDIVDLTDSNTGLNAATVRLLSVEEDEHGLLDIVAEECPEGIGHAATVATQGNSGATVDPDADPGPVAGPYLFRGPGFLVGNNKPEIWCAVTGDGNPLWAGCDVYLSHDGTSYTYLCSYARQARYGYITNSMAVQSDPDTVSVPNVVLNGYNTQLLGGSQADADQFITLAMIDDEIVSYETAALEAGPSYNLSYLRRGGYGTAIAAHSANAPFVRLDDGILRIPVDPSQIGQTIHLKFLSVNCFGRTPRTLSGETAYSYVIGSSVELPDVPVTPASFAVLSVADGVNITWINNNPAAAACTSIEYATSSSGPWTVLAQCGPTTDHYTHHFTNGATYYYRARARGPVIAAGWSAYTATFNSAGVNVSAIAGQASAAYNPFQNLCPNPSFELGPLNQVPFGWTDGGGGNGWHAGDQTTSLGVPFKTFAEIQVSSSTPITDVLYSSYIPVGASAAYSIALRYMIARTLSAGDFSADIEWYTSAKAYIGNSARVFRASADTAGNAVVAQLPNQVSPSTAAFARVRLYAEGAAETGGGTYCRASFVKFEIGAICTPYSDDATQYGNNVAVPNSGQQLGDQRNLPSSISRNFGMVRSATALTAHAGGAVDVNAHDVYMGNATIHYNAHTSAVTGLATGSSYWIYTRDNYAGGSPAFTFTTSAGTANSFDDAYNAGQVTIPSSGTSGGGGAGGTGTCVMASMYLRRGLTARDLAKRWRWWKPWLWFIRGHDGLHLIRHKPFIVREPCVRIIAADGEWVGCSVSTPVTSATGESVAAPNMYGHMIATEHGWKRVADVCDAGLQDVVRINCGGHNIYAGADWRARLSTHNWNK